MKELKRVYTRLMNAMVEQEESNRDPLAPFYNILKTKI